MKTQESGSALELGKNKHFEVLTYWMSTNETQLSMMHFPYMIDDYPRLQPMMAAEAAVHAKS
jgi:hypothetical protein